MKKFLREFKEFAMRGNVMDLAVGVIVGAAFKAIVDSLVKDIISPIIGLFAKKDFSGLVLRVAGVEIGYGAFITAVINFAIMSFVIFLFVKFMNRLAAIGQKKEEIKEEVTMKKCPHCCMEIAKQATRCPHCTSEVEA